MAKDSWNLPPGCRPDMIPGNSEEDIKFEKFVDENLESLAEEWVEENLDEVKKWATVMITDDPEDSFKGLFWKYLLQNFNGE